MVILEVPISENEVLRCIHLYKCKATPLIYTVDVIFSAPVVFWLQTDVIFFGNHPCNIPSHHPFTVTLLISQAFSQVRLLDSRCPLASPILWTQATPRRYNGYFAARECWHRSSSPVQRIPVSHQMRLGEWDVWMIWWFFKASYVVMWLTAGRHTRKSISSHMYITLWIMHVYYFILCICVHI